MSRPERPPSGPPPGRSEPIPLPRRLLAEETLIVLSLSLLASAVFAILSLLEAPLRGVTVASVSQSTQLARQIFGSLFSLAPVWLVVYLVRRSGEGLEGIGMRWDRPRQDIGRGVLLFLVVGAAGIGLNLPMKPTKAHENNVLRPDCRAGSPTPHCTTSTLINSAAGRRR